MIDTTKSVDDLYTDLCVRFRQLSLGKANGTWVCTNCGRPENNHHLGARKTCTNYVTSLAFQAVETEQLTEVQTALGLLDKLKELGK
jgi:hypothetical protein